MKKVGAFEAKTHFSSLLEEVEQGQHITITKHGRPVAKLVPFGKADIARRDHAIERLKAFRQGNSLGGISWKDLRDEGRRF